MPDEIPYKDYAYWWLETYGPAGEFIEGVVSLTDEDYAELVVELNKLQEAKRLVGWVLDPYAPETRTIGAQESLGLVLDSLPPIDE